MNIYGPICINFDNFRECGAGKCGAGKCGAVQGFTPHPEMEQIISPKIRNQPDAWHPKKVQNLQTLSCVCI